MRCADVVIEPYPGALWVAALRDLAGTVIGVRQTAYAADRRHGTIGLD
jgi:hypothetical protein